MQPSAKLRGSVRRHRRSARLIAGVLAGWLPAQSLLSGRSAYAYHAFADTSQGTISYLIDPAVTQTMGSNLAVELGGGAWDVDSRGELYFDHFDPRGQAANNRVYMQYIDGPYNILALASTPCHGTNCNLWFDTSEPWYGGTGTPGGLQVDAWAVAAHEFGHWAGLHHSPDQRPSTDPSVPTMLASAHLDARTITQDDANGFHRSRSDTNTIANASFEIASPFYGWKFRGSPNGGSAARYCQPGARSGSCFVQFNGNGAGGASMYQDLVDTGFHGTTPWSGHAWVRADGPPGSGNHTVVVAVWDLDQGQTLGSTTCAIPRDGSYHRCPGSGGVTATKPGSTVRMRFEVYNHSAHNISIDDFSLH